MEFVLLIFIFVLLVVYIYKANYSPEETLSQQLTSVDAEAVTLGDVIITPSGPEIEVSKEKDPKGKDKVIKHRSPIDGKEYLVAASLPDREKAANFLAEIFRREQYLLQRLDEMLDEGSPIKASDGEVITDNMKRLVKKHFKKVTPFAEYHNPSDQTVGSNSAKGELVEICLRSKSKPDQWNSINTAFRVHVHELAHSADSEFRADGNHGPVFNRLMNFLLEVAEDIEIYNCGEYKSSGKKFCGLVLQETDTFCK
jgi:hypothetical protein